MPKRARREADAALAKIPAVSGGGAQQTPGLDNDAVRVLDQAEQIAQKAGDSFVTVERLLLALALATTTAAGKALQGAGVDARGAQRRDQRAARRPHRRHRGRRGPLRRAQEVRARPHRRRRATASSTR